MRFVWWERLKAAVFFIVGITVAFFSAVATFFINAVPAVFNFLTEACKVVLLTKPAMVFVLTMLGVFAFGLIVINNTAPIMKTCDQTYECFLFPVADGAVTYALRPLNDFVLLPPIRYFNDVSEYVKDKSNEMVDRIRVATRGKTTRFSAAEVMDALWSFFWIDMLESPYKATLPEWGPDRVVMPFTALFIRSVVMFITDNFGINRHGWMALEHLFLSMVRGDTLTNSCYFQHLKNPDETDWAFRGCKMFEGSSCTNYSDHMNGTCPGCYDFTDELIYHMGAYVIEWIGGILPNATDELMDVVHSLTEADVCSALNSATCVPQGTGCLCTNYDCTILPWWVHPKTFPSIHCHVGNVTKFFPLPGCELVHLCHDKPFPDKCARVDRTMGFRGMTCAEVMNVSSLGRRKCETIDNPTCFEKDFTYWINEIMRTFWSFPIAIADRGCETAQCIADWFKSFVGMILYIFDKNCLAKPLEKVQYVVRYVLWDWTGCTIPIIKLITPWKLSPIGIGYQKGWHLISLMIPKVLDGTIITQSGYYCKVLRGTLPGCQAFAGSYEYWGCHDVPKNMFFDGSQSGLVLANVTCASIGFGHLCKESTPCLGTSTSRCSFFNNTYCYDLRENALGWHIMNHSECRIQTANRNDAACLEAYRASSEYTTCLLTVGVNDASECNQWVIDTFNYTRCSDILAPSYLTVCDHAALNLYDYSECLTVVGAGNSAACDAIVAARFNYTQCLAITHNPDLYSFICDDILINGFDYATCVNYVNNATLTICEDLSVVIYDHAECMHDLAIITANTCNRVTAIVPSYTNCMAEKLVIDKMTCDAMYRLTPEYATCVDAANLVNAAACDFLEDNGILVPGKTCPDMKGGCAFRRQDPDGTCYMFSGCGLWKKAFRPDGACVTGIGLHDLTSEYFDILRNATVDTVLGFFSFTFNEWTFSPSQKAQNMITALIDIVFDVGKCTVDVLKAAFGVLNLVFDKKCKTNFKESLNFIVDDLIANSVKCMYTITRFLHKVELETISEFSRRIIYAMSDVAPHIWHLAFFHSDTWYCQQDIHFALLDGQTPWYLWENGRWAFDGCAMMNDGECATAWDICYTENTTTTCTCPACNDPIADVVWVGMDITEWLFNAIVDVMNLRGVLADAVQLFVDIIRMGIDTMLACTVGWMKNIVGFFIILFAPGCTAKGAAIAVYFAQYFVLFPFVELLNFVINLLVSLGTFIWDLLKTLFDWLIDETKVFAWIYNAIDDAAQMGYCFKGNLTGTENFIFKQRPAYMHQLYDFPKCMADWPKKDCDLSGCFTEAWKCVKYFNVTANPPVERTYGWLGKAMVGMEGLITTIMNTVDAVVCPWPCIKECKNCKGLMRLKCFFKCFKDPSFSCIKTNEINEDQQIIYQIYDLECDLKCQCDVQENEYSCQLPCWIMDGVETNQRRFPCLTPSEASVICNAHIDQSYILSEYVFSFVSDNPQVAQPHYDAMEFQNFWPLPDDSVTYSDIRNSWMEDHTKNPTQICTQYSNLYVYWDFIDHMWCEDVYNCTEIITETVHQNCTDSNVTGTIVHNCTEYTVYTVTTSDNCTLVHLDNCTQAQRSVYLKFKRAKEFCWQTCTDTTATDFYTELMRVRAGCVALYMILRNPEDPIEAYRAMQETLPGIPIPFLSTTLGPASILDLFYHRFNEGDRAWWGDYVIARHGDWGGVPPRAVYYPTNPSFTYCQAIPWSQHYFDGQVPYVDRVWNLPYCGIFDCSCCHYMKRIIARIFSYSILPDPRPPTVMTRTVDDVTRTCTIRPTTPSWHYLVDDGSPTWKNEVVFGNTDITAKMETIEWDDTCDFFVDVLQTNCTQLRTPGLAGYVPGTCLSSAAADFSCSHPVMPALPEAGGYTAIGPNSLICNGTTTEPAYVCNAIIVTVTIHKDNSGNVMECSMMSDWTFTGYENNSISNPLNVMGYGGTNYSFVRGRYANYIASVDGCMVGSNPADCGGGCTYQRKFAELFTCTARHCIIEDIVTYSNDSTPEFKPYECPADYRVPEILTFASRDKPKKIIEYPESPFIQARLEELLTPPPSPLAVRAKASAERTRNRKQKRDSELGPCVCATVLDEGRIDIKRDDFRTRLMKTYCEAAKLIYDENKDDPGAKEAYCLALTPGIDPVRNTVDAVRFLASDVTKEESILYAAARNFAAREILKVAFEEPEDDPYIARLKNAVSGGVTAIQSAYTGSVVEAIVNDGWTVYEREKLTGEVLKDEESEWAINSVSKLYDWTQEQRVLSQAHPPRPGRYIPGIGHRNTLEGLHKLTKRILEPIGRLPPDKQVSGAMRIVNAILAPEVETAPETCDENETNLWDGVYNIRKAVENTIDFLSSGNETDEEAIAAEQAAPVLVGFQRIFGTAVNDLSNWTPHWKSNTEPRPERTYIFFKGSDKLLEHFTGGFDKFTRVFKRQWNDDSFISAMKLQETIPADYSTSGSAADTPIRLIADKFQPQFSSVVNSTSKAHFRSTGKKFWHGIVELIRCHSPEQYNGSNIYNIFCIALPEGLLNWVPAEGVMHPQIAWGDEIITENYVKTDFPEGTRGYWTMFRSNCPHDHLSHPEFPHCPGCDYVEREYDPSLVRMDIFDCMLMMINGFCRIFHNIFDPEFTGAFNPTWVDSVHFCFNFFIIFTVVSIAIVLLTGSTLGLYIAIGICAIYAMFCGFTLHTVVTLIAYTAYGAYLAVPVILIFMVLLIVGGVRYYFDLVGLFATAFQALQKIPFIGHASFMLAATERFERLTFGDGEIPHVYVSLTCLYFSKDALALLILFFAIVCFVVPFFIILAYTLVFFWTMFVAFAQGIMRIMLARQRIRVIKLEKQMKNVKKKYGTMEARMNAQMQSMADQYGGGAGGAGAFQSAQSSQAAGTPGFFEQAKASFASKFGGSSAGGASKPVSAAKAPSATKYAKASTSSSKFSGLTKYFKK